MTRPLARVALPLVALVAAAAVARAQAPVIVVPASQHLQPAIDAAPEGAVLLLEFRIQNTAVSITGKSLTLQADTGQSVRLLGGLTIGQLGPAQSVRLRGLSVEHATLRLADDQGLVWIEDCFLLGDQGGTALMVETCSNVVLLGSSIESLDLIFNPPSLVRGGDGLATAGQGSSIHAYDCFIRGGDGSQEAGSQGGDAVRLASAADFAFLSGCRLQGGNSDQCEPGGCFSYGRGGDALDAAGTAWVHDSLLLAGQMVSLYCIFCSPSHDGRAERGPHIGHLPGKALKVDVPSPAREHEAVQIQIEGPPNVPVFLGAALAPQAIVSLDLVGGTVLVPLGLHSPVVGFTDGTGHLTVTRQMPPVSTGAYHAFWQFYTLERRPGPYLRTDARPGSLSHQVGAGTMVVLLDGAF